uniref:Uncharacterized protein n=1 Tax=Parascaris univalens TaxID=6257 RepID=A0A914ZVV7_PARUN
PFQIIITTASVTFFSECRPYRLLDGCSVRWFIWRRLLFVGCSIFCSTFPSKTALRFVRLFPKFQTRDHSFSHRLPCYICEARSRLHFPPLSTSLCLKFLIDS